MATTTFEFVFDASKATSSIKAATSASDKLEGNLKDIDNAATRAQKGVDKATASLKRMALQAVGITALVGAAKSAVSTFAAFDTTMRKVGAVSGATGKELDALRDIAKKMGRETKFSASEAAEGLTFLSMAGFSAGESVEALPHVLNLASAGATDLGKAADIATNIMSGFSIEAKDLAAANDVLVGTFTSSNTNLSELGRAFSVVGPLAQAAGLEFKDVAVELGLMANAGIKGSRAGTALAGAITRLLKPVGEAEDAIKELGLEVRNTDGTMRPFRDILDDLKVAGVDVADVIRIFGQEAGPEMQALIAASTESVKGLRDAVDQVGVTSEIAAEQNAGLGGSLKALSSAIEGLVIEIMEGVSPALQAMIDGLTSAIRKTVEFAGVITDVLGVALVVLLGHLTRITIATGAAFVTAMVGATAKAGLLTIALKGLSAVMSLLGGASGIILLTVYAVWRLTDGFKSQTEKAKEATQAAMAHLTALKGLIAQTEAAIKSSDGLSKAFIAQARAAIESAKANIAQQKSIAQSMKAEVELEKAFMDGTATTLDNAAATNEASKKMKEANKAYNDAMDTIVDLEGDVIRLSAALDVHGESMSNVTDATEDSEKASKELEDAFGDLRNKGNDLINTTKNLKTATEETRAETGKLAVETGILSDALGDADAHVLSYAEHLRGEAVAAAKEASKAADDTAKAFDDFTKRMDQTASNVSDTLSGMFVDFVIDGRSAMSSVQSMFKQMLSNMISMALQHPVRVVLQMVTGGAIGSAIGGGASGDLMSGLPGINLLSQAGQAATGGFNIPGLGLFSEAIGGSLLAAGIGIPGGFGVGLASTGANIAMNGFLGGTMASLSQAGSFLSAGSYMAALGTVAPYIAAIAAIAAAFGLFGGGAKKSEGQVKGFFDAEGNIKSKILEDKNFVIKPFLDAINGIEATTTVLADKLGASFEGVTIDLKGDEGGVTATVLGGGQDFVEKIDPEDITADLWAQMTLAALRQSNLDDVAAPLAAFLGNVTENAIKELDATEIQDLLTWMISVAEVAEIASETFEGITTSIENFEGSIEEMQLFTDSLIKIGVAFSKTPMEIVEEALVESSLTVFEVLDKTSVELTDVMTEFDGTAASASSLANATLAFQQAALAAAVAIKQAFAIVEAQTQATIASIEYAMLAEQDRYDFLINEAQALADEISSMTDPTEIAQTVQDINSLILQAFQLLPEEMQQELGPGLIAFLQSVEEMADLQLEGLETTLAETWNEQIEAMDFTLLENASSKMAEASDNQQDAARHMHVAAGQMRDAASRQASAAATILAAANAIPSEFEVEVTTTSSEIGV